MAADVPINILSHEGQMFHTPTLENCLVHQHLGFDYHITCNLFFITLFLVKIIGFFE